MDFSWIVKSCESTSVRAKKKRRKKRTNRSLLYLILPSKYTREGKTWKKTIDSPSLLPRSARVFSPRIPFFSFFRSATICTLATLDRGESGNKRKAGRWLAWKRRDPGWLFIKHTFITRRLHILEGFTRSPRPLPLPISLSLVTRAGLTRLYRE